MINREYQKVNILTFSEETDDYGQLRQQAPTSQEIDMVCKIYAQTMTNDMRYKDVEMIGITKNNSITDENEIQIGNINYKVMYVIPSGKYYQILMRK